eukprot:SAG11_NODE_3871_length_2178_cov_1.060606_2_plen_72_part_00
MLLQKRFPLIMQWHGRHGWSVVIVYFFHAGSCIASASVLGWLTVLALYMHEVSLIRQSNWIAFAQLVKMLS